MKDAIIPHKRVMDSKRWSRLRLLKLRTTPFCEACGAVGRLTPATVVHHIKAVNDGGDPYPGLDGLQPLCKHCHDTVTRFEQLGQPRGLRVAMTEACRLTRIISGIGNSPDKNETGGGVQESYDRPGQRARRRRNFFQHEVDVFLQSFVKTAKNGENRPKSAHKIGNFCEKPPKAPVLTSSRGEFPAMPAYSDPELAAVTATHRSQEPAPTSEAGGESSLPRSPPHLKTDGARLWCSIMRQYRIGDGAGLALLTAACEALDRMRQAQAAIEEHGVLVADRYGGLKTNPAVAIERDARNGMIGALRELHLDLEPVRDRGEHSTVFRRK
jgi:phage terminase small subunit